MWMLYVEGSQLACSQSKPRGSHGSSSVSKCLVCVCVHVCSPDRHEDERQRKEKAGGGEDQKVKGNTVKIFTFVEMMKGWTLCKAVIKSA